MFEEKPLTIRSVPCIEVQPLGTKALYWRESFSRKVMRQVLSLLEERQQPNQPRGKFLV